MKSNHTKQQLSDALLICMKTTPLEDITIQQIVDEAHVSRQTFYRQFQDKYALANWFFDQLLDASFAHMGKGKTIYDGLIHKFEYIKKERIYFTNAFRTDTQNNLKQHDFEKIVAFYKNLILEKSHHPIDEEIKELLEMYCYASVYKTQEWVLHGMPLSTHDLALLMIEAMPKKLADLFRKLEILD